MKDNSDARDKFTKEFFIPINREAIKVEIKEAVIFEFSAEGDIMHEVNCHTCKYGDLQPKMLPCSECVQHSKHVIK